MKGCHHWHRKPPVMGYLAWHHDTEVREESGEKQHCCPSCHLWIWETYCRKALIERKWHSGASGRRKGAKMPIRHPKSYKSS